MKEKKFYDTIENFVKSVNILFHYINFKIKYNQQNIWNLIEIVK